MARTSTTGVSYFANPKGGLSIRGPLDNNRMNGRIANPPRFGKWGGLDVPADKGFKENAFRIAAPGMTADNPIKSGKIGQNTKSAPHQGDADTNWA